MATSDGARPDMPAQLGRYRRKKLLGGGGMGTVYLVENTELQREEALKVPRFDSGDDPDVRERFLREARLAAKLDHPNLCPVYDVGVIDGVYFLTMRYLKGKPLSDYSGKAQPPRKAIEIVAKLAQALEHAHGQGVIHRDLKPSNVMLCPGTGPTVLDFGLAKKTQQDEKLTQTGTALGTPAYMPPEQIKGELNKIGPASDVYSLGVILYELLTGHRPFVGSAAEVFGKILYIDPPLPSQFLPGLHPDLDAICCKALAKAPEARFPSMKAFVMVLADYLRATASTDGTGKLAANPPAADIFQAPTVRPHQAVAGATPEHKFLPIPPPPVGGKGSRVTGNAGARRGNPLDTVVVDEARARTSSRNDGRKGGSRSGGAPPRPRSLTWLAAGVGICFAVALLLAGAFSLWQRDPVDEPMPPVDYANPVLALKFHDALQPSGEFLPASSMRFGLGLPDPKGDTQTPFLSKLIYDDFGRTNNVCVRIDKQPGTEHLWGLQQGSWEAPMKQDLGMDLSKRNRLIGAKSVWIRPAPPIKITQWVEIVPGGLSADGKKRLLDTCLIRYDILNDDGVAHFVGLRFLLDTFIGSNDAVPFTIAGAKEMCDTKMEFNKPEDVPDYISALEKQDLNDPGTVAHISLKYGGMEPPTRVTLGAWPAASLRTVPGGAKADMQNTLWNVPVLPMALAKSPENPKGDSAVTLYWDDKEIAPKQTRVVGFAYGLGSVTGEKGGGQLGMTAGGELAVGKDFTLTAFVKNPAPGASVTLALPRNLELTGGSTLKETVPTIPPGSSSFYSPVTWRVKASKPGVYKVQVTLDSGASLVHKIVVVKDARLFN